MNLKHTPAQKNIQASPTCHRVDGSLERTLAAGRHVWNRARRRSWGRMFSFPRTHWQKRRAKGWSDRPGIFLTAILPRENIRPGNNRFLSGPPYLIPYRPSGRNDSSSVSLPWLDSFSPSFSFGLCYGPRPLPVPGTVLVNSWHSLDRVTELWRIQLLNHVSHYFPVSL